MGFSIFSDRSVDASESEALLGREKYLDHGNKFLNYNRSTSERLQIWCQCGGEKQGKKFEVMPARLQPALGVVSNPYTGQKFVR
jgi:hypothetical protein